MKNSHQRCACSRRANLSVDDVRREIDARTARRIVTSQSNEVPFSDEAKSVLAYAAQEADRLLHQHIGTEHLLLGLFREERGMAATILAEQGLRIATVRDQIVEMLSASSALTRGLSIQSVCGSRRGVGPADLAEPTESARGTDGSHQSSERQR